MVLAIVALLAKACAVGCVVAVIDNSFAKLRLFKITAEEFVAGAFLLAVLGVFTLYLGGGCFTGAPGTRRLRGRGQHHRRGRRERRWTERLSFSSRSPGYSFAIPARDENGFRALAEIRGKGINLVADAVAQSADHVKRFFSMLRIELAFYLGCLNLRERLDAKGEPACLPSRSRPASARSPRRASTT